MMMGVPMNNAYTAILKEDDGWWIGWIEEIPGTNCQESTREALLESMRIVLQEALEFNRQEAIDAAGENYEVEPIFL
jgi:predicted RNase H-like HicB family nuclease